MKTIIHLNCDGTGDCPHKPSKGTVYRCIRVGCEGKNEDHYATEEFSAVCDQEGRRCATHYAQHITPVSKIEKKYHSINADGFCNLGCC